MNNIMMVAIGGFLGAIARFTLSKTVQVLLKSRFPIGTLSVNVVGAFLLGVLVGTDVKGQWYSLFGVGFMGAFTTFSTLKLELVQLRRDGEFQLFNRYLLCSYGFGLLISFCGILVGKSI
ncbi:MULTISPECIES: fluoride efflux transporter FluC [Bacillaceae]|uniref:fluoride efflux transporter FluC n=1 Tax=Bacillaceae TaxID=186817 RepID=UPI0030000E42